MVLDILSNEFKTMSINEKRGMAGIGHASCFKFILTHVLDKFFTELGTFHFLCAIHLTGKVVRYNF